MFQSENVETRLDSCLVRLAVALSGPFCFVQGVVTSSGKTRTAMLGTGM